jgi:hypothetical protein
VKELALQGITDFEKATKYINDVFIPRYNKKFAIKAEDPEASWRKAPKNLKEILGFTIQVGSLFLMKSLVRRRGDILPLQIG